MTPLYRNSGIWTRTVAYFVVAVGATLWGVFELWHGTRVEGGDASSGAMFGVIFIGGGAYALWQVVVDWRDTVVTLDRDADGALVATIWSLTGPVKLRGDFRNWRFHVAIAGRNTRTYFIFADHAGLTRPLRFDLRRGVDLTGLRTVAPEAVADFEATQPAKVS